ncbi:MAG: glycosyltransferase [Desulfosalsimonadaceae bacterium]
MSCTILIVNDSKRQGFIKTLNEAAARITVKYIVYLAQDAWPGRDWLRCACEIMDKSGKGLLAFNDGKWKGRIASFGMVRTGWVRTLYNGWIFYPGYVSHAADNELTVVARAQDMYVYNPDCTLMEYDPEKDFGGSNPKDRALFQKRFLQGFDGLAPLTKLEGLAQEYSVKWDPREAGKGVSIIILTQNGARCLEHLLDGFFRTNTHSPVEIIIIDNGSTDNTSEVVSRFSTRGFIRLVMRENNDSFAGSANLGAEKARYPYLFFLKNDTIYSSDLLPAALTKLEDLSIGAAGARWTDNLETLSLGFEITAAGLNQFQIFLCRKNGFGVLDKKGKKFRAANKNVRTQTAIFKPKQLSPVSGFFPDTNEPESANIVLYTCGELDVLRRGLLSLRQFTDLQKNTLFLIDDSQNSYVGEKIVEWTRDLDFFERVTHRQRQGFCSALRDLIMDVKWGDFCVISDSAVLTPGWLTGLKKAAYCDQRIGLASPVTPSHPLYAFQMNPGDNIITCAKKLSMVSVRQYPLIPVPDMAVFYLKQSACRHHPLPPFCHDSVPAYFLEYAAGLAQAGRYCILADDIFVHAASRSVPSPEACRDLLLRKYPQNSNDARRIFDHFIGLKLVSLQNYVASDIRLDTSRTLAVFFNSINLGGGTLVLVEFCNDLILNGWNIVAILLNKRQKESVFFDLLFEPYPSTDAWEISARLGGHGFLMATFWSTAKLVEQTAALCSAYTPFYFIQDFEVMFYNPEGNSADLEEYQYYEQACQSYRFDFLHLATSEWISERVRSFLKKPDQHIQKIRIGFNPELYYPEPNCRSRAKPFRIIAMARPRTPRRGFADLVKTLSIVYNQNPDIEIFLYGTNDLSEFSIPFPFHNLGVVRPQELRKYYNLAHVYIDTSLFQGYGLTGLEAMACGCACVLSDSGGPAEYAQNEKNALFAPSGDIHALANAVLRLLNHEDLRKGITTDAIMTARQFSIHHAADDFEQIAGQIIAARETSISRNSSDGICNIIVPIFNQISAVRNCLLSIEAGTDLPYRVIIVDDCSDKHTASFLQQFAAGRKGFDYVRNEKNLGFVGSVNAGLKVTKSGDIVLLNSDTIVTPGWLAKLVRCAESDPHIGIISPLSTRSSHLWIKPNPGETIFETAKNIEKISRSQYPDVVTPEGWCFYIKRRVYETLGGFDPVFGRGYCEESDYSMRAMANGWRTVCCDDTFIFHEGMVTFKDQRGPRYQHNRKIFDKRWKHYYQKEYQAFLTRNPLGHLRRRHQALAPVVFNDPAQFSAQGKKSILEIIPEVAPAEVIRRYQQQLEDPAFKTRLWRETGGNPRSVVFLVQQMERYGGILSVVQLANDLVLMGLEVKVVVLTSKNYQEFPGLLTRPVFFEDHVSLIENFPQTDIVVATLWTTVYFMAAIFARHPDFLPLYFVQDFEPDFYSDREKRIRKLIEDTYRLAPYAFAKTPWLCGKIRALGVRITEVPPALDLDLFYPGDTDDSGDGPKKILTMLRPHTPQRGFETAVQVLKRLYESRRDIEIHVFGCEDMELQKQGLLFPVVNHGIVPSGDLPDLYSQARIFVEFSNFHGFGRTIAEAMACGCACVITDSGGVSLFARHEENALIAPPRDIHALVTQINRLCDDDDLRERLAANARPGVLQFDHLHSAQKTLEFFRQCLSMGREVETAAEPQSLAV